MGSDSKFTLFDNTVALIQILEILGVDVFNEIYMFRLTCARGRDGVLVERVYLKCVTTCDMFAEGIFGLDPLGDDGLGSEP